MGGVGEALGRLLGTLGRLLAVLGAFKIQLLQTIGSRWAPRDLLDRFWVDLGRAWGGFGRGLGKDLDDFEKTCSRLWTPLAK